MAFPQVASASNGGGSSLSGGMSVTLPSGVTAGDLLLVIAAYDGQGTEITATGSGWTRVGNMQSINQVTAAVFWKIADGANTLQLALVGNSVAETGGWICYRITGAATVSAVECQQTNAETVAGTVSNAPNPPSLTPSWGADDTLWIAATAWDNATVSLSSYPASYASNQQYYAGGAASANVAVAAATRELNAGSEDPAAFLISGAEQWVAFTVGVKSATGASGASGTIAATTNPAVASITGSAGSSGASGAIAATTNPAVASITGSVGTFSGDIRLTLGIQRERGGPAASLSSLKWVVFNADHTAVIASGTSLTTNASGLAVIDLNGTSYNIGDYVPVLITDYNAATTASDRVVRSVFGFVPAAAQS